ncbi:MAG TPA: roadblock/LC7 domain-containing protein [Kofleriaceae bacterium]|nr:roadblock/LC7 domain-containing protein [Kofleriaceae bacterium]
MALVALTSVAAHGGTVTTLAQSVNQHLRTLRTSTPEIIGAVVVNMDGFVVSSVIPSEVDDELIGGMAAAVIGVGERIAADLMRAQMEQVYIRSPKGYVIINSINEQSALVLLVTRDAKLGLIFLELRRVVEELNRVI